MGRGECSAVEDFARRGACPPLGRRRGVAEPTVPIRCYQTTTPAVSYLGVPAPAGMSDCYESMSRTPIRDAPFNKPRCRLSTGESCRVVDPWPSAERENVVRGLVPRWGGGGAWQNPPCQLAVPNNNSGFSYLGVPAPAGMSDCYESMSRTPIRDAPFNKPRCRLSTGESCRVVDPWPSAERENVVRGLVPRWGGGGAWQNPPCQLAVPNNNSGFSYLGVPAPAGMSDCYESKSRTPIRDTPFNKPRCRLSTGESCRVVDPLPSAERENVVRGLVPRWGGGGAWQTPPCQFAAPNHNSGVSYLGVPAAAGMSDCYESMSRTPIRDGLVRDRLSPLNSSFQRKLESRRSGEGGDRRTMKKSPDTPAIFVLLCGLRKAMVIPEGVGRGDCSAGAFPQPSSCGQPVPIVSPGAPAFSTPLWALARLHASRRKLQIQA